VSGLEAQLRVQHSRDQLVVQEFRTFYQFQQAVERLVPKDREAPH